MDELIGRLVAKIGIDQTVAFKAVGIILAFLAHEGPSDKVEALIGRLPGAEKALEAAGGVQAGGGGLMGAGMKLMGMGLGMEQIQSIVRELIAYARERGGQEELRAIADAVPSLAQFS
jgi:hypothetical protein